MTIRTLYALAIAYIIISIIAITNSSFYFSFQGENEIVELSGAFALLLTSIMLVKTGLEAKKLNKKKYITYTFFAMGVFFFWAAGEEISWGQHLFGTQTPSWLMEINDQNETNLHNINKKFFDRYLRRVTLLMSLFACILHIRRKTHLWGFKLPDYPLNIGFLVHHVYRKIFVIKASDWMLSLVFLLIYPVLAIKRKDKRLLAFSAIALTTFFIVYYLKYEHGYIYGKGLNYYHEIRETAFAFLCLIYSIDLFKDIKNDNETSS